MQPETEVKKEAQQQQVDTTPIANQEAKEDLSEKEINWKKFKEARQKDREHAEAMSKKAAEKEAEAQALKEAMEALLDKKLPQRQSNDYFEEPEEDEDKRIEKKVISALEQYEKRKFEEQQKREQQLLPVRLKEYHKDFDEVCSSENLDYLEYHYPEVATAFNHMPDNIQKWDAVYKAVKRFVPNTNTAKDVAKINKNLNNPQSISASVTPQGNAPIPSFQLTEKRRQENWERMQRIMKSTKD